MKNIQHKEQDIMIAIDSEKRNDRVIQAVILLLDDIVTLQKHNKKVSKKRLEQYRLNLSHILAQYKKEDIDRNAEVCENIIQEINSHE